MNNVVKQNQKELKVEGEEPSECTVDILARTNRASIFWAAIFIAVMLMLVIQSFLITQVIRQKQRVIVTDAVYDVHITRVQDFQDSKDLIFYIARLAAFARLERSYQGLKNETLFKQVYLPRAARKAEKELEKDNDFFNEREIYQECILEKAPQVIDFGPNDIMLCLYGRLLRTGTFREREYVQYLDFRLDLHLKRNPYLKKQGRLPLAVFNYKFKTRLHRSVAREEG